MDMALEPLFAEMSIGVYFVHKGPHKSLGKRCLPERFGADTSIHL
jgi:hypothetical protein